MQMKRLKPASVLLALSLILLPSCRTPSSGLPTDVIERQETLVTEAKAEMCRGQTPIPVNASPNDPPWPIGAQQYVRANICQWASACDREAFHQMDCPP